MARVDKHIDIFYKFLCGKLLKFVDVSHDQISFEKARWVLSRHGLPRVIRMSMIAHMTKLGYLKRISQRQGLKILAKPIIVDEGIIKEEF